VWAVRCSPPLVREHHTPWSWFCLDRARLAPWAAGPVLVPSAACPLIPAQAALPPTSGPGQVRQGKGWERLPWLIETINRCYDGDHELLPWLIVSWTAAMRDGDDDQTGRCRSSSRSGPGPCADSTPQPDPSAPYLDEEGLWRRPPKNRGLARSPYLGTAHMHPVTWCSIPKPVHQIAAKNQDSPACPTWVLSIVANDAQRMTWCRIRELCILSCEDYQLGGESCRAWWCPRGQAGCCHAHTGHNL
jgi:hypothetical protein